MVSLNPCRELYQFINFDAALGYLQYDIRRVKANFEQIISDSDIDLEYRWKRWCEAPDYLKNDYKTNGEAAEIVANAFGVLPFTDTDQTINTEELVQFIENFPINYEHLQLKALKEIILKYNVLYFKAL